MPAAPPTPAARKPGGRGGGPGGLVQTPLVFGLLFPVAATPRAFGAGRSDPPGILSSGWGRSGDLIKPLIVYALLSLIAATRRPLGAGRSDPTDILSNGGRPATGAFGATRSTDEPRSVQHDRAREDARGRRASAPWQIPWSGWKGIFWRTDGQIGEGRLPSGAGGGGVFW